MKTQRKKRTSADVPGTQASIGRTAANMRVRASLMREIQSLVKAAGLPQSKMAKHLGVTQPRLNNLLRGRIDKFSLDALVRMVARTGRRVEIRVIKGR